MKDRRLCWTQFSASSQRNVRTASLSAPLQVSQLHVLIRSLCLDVRAFRRRHCGDEQCGIQWQQGTRTLRLIFSGLSSTDRNWSLCVCHISCLPSADHCSASSDFEFGSGCSPGWSSGFHLLCCSSFSFAVPCLLSVCFVQVAAHVQPIATDTNMDEVDTTIFANTGAMNMKKQWMKQPCHVSMCICIGHCRKGHTYIGHM